MYSDVFCRVYNELGWNYFPEAFAEELLQWLTQQGIAVKSSLDLACGSGVLEVLEMQAPGAKKMNAKAYLMGKNIPVGTIFSRERTEA